MTNAKNGIVISENIVSIDGYNFIKLDIRGLKRAIKYKHKNLQYNNYVGLILLILVSNKHEVYLPTTRNYPKFIYSLFRKSIILESILFNFNGSAIGIHEILHPNLFKYNKLIYKKVGGIGFYDFSILNYID